MKRALARLTLIFLGGGVLGLITVVTWPILPLGLVCAAAVVGISYGIALLLEAAEW